MECLNYSPSPQTVEMRCATDFNEEDSEQVVVIELVIPKAYVVPVAQQSASTASALVQPVAVTSTVPAAGIVQLRANNTALGAAWRTTATLAVPPHHPMPIY